MIGLDQAGKTIILYKLNLKGPKRFLVDMIMFECLYYENFFFTSLDLGASIPYNKFWNYYHSQHCTAGIIYVIDSNSYNKYRIQDQDLNEIKKILTDEKLKNCPILFLANKKNLKTDISPDEIKDILDLKKIDGRNWNIKECCEITG